jgi:hypothetical protein
MLSEIPHKKNYYRASKANRKVRRLEEDEKGELCKTNQGSKQPILYLPEITTVPIYQAYRRFIATSTVSGDITIQDLLNQFLFAATSVLAYPYCAQIRLKKIRALSPVTTQGTSVLCSMKPRTIDTGNNCFNAVQETYIDTSASIDIPAYLHLSPSIKTPLGAWHYNTTTNTNLLQVTFPAGTTCDLLLEWIPTWNNQSAPPYLRVIAAGTVGKTFATAILTNLIPQGIEYI